MKIWQVLVITTVAIALILGMAVQSLANSDVVATPNSNATGNDGPPAWGERLPRIVRGEVTDKDDNSFDIKPGRQTILVDENTKYFIQYPPEKLLAAAQQRIGLGPRVIEPADPRQLGAPYQAQQSKWLIWAKLKLFRFFGEEASFDDIAVGDKVAVWLAPDSDGYLARVVTIIKPMTYDRVSGTITAVSDDSITIEPVSSGAEVTLECTGDTIFILQGIIEVKADAEQFACAVYNAETEIARIVRVWPEVPQTSK